VDHSARVGRLVGSDPRLALEHSVLEIN
jgi:hypothetical protein